MLTTAEGVLLVLGESEDVVVENLHVEALRAADDLLPDGAQTHDAERLAGELIHALLSDVADTPLPRHDVVVHPGEPLEDGENEHYGVLGDGHRVRPAVVGDGHPRPASGLDVEPIIAGADELDQLELGRGLVERGVHAPAGEAHQVLGLLDCLRELRVFALEHDELEAGRDHAAGDVHDALRKGRAKHDLGGHAALLSSRRPPRRRRDWVTSESPY